jgi:hypothetical protein
MEESEIKKMERTKIMGTRKEVQKKKDTKGRAQAQEITETAKVRILYWNVAGLRKKEQEF